MISQEVSMSSQPELSPPGQMVDIGGFRLHAIVQGQGAPVVLLEPALGGFALQYTHIQAGVSAFTRVLAYDRAGQAWSDVSPHPRTPVNLAGELKTLLCKLDLQPPYILVGHSFGGLLTRFYAGFYPQDVAGVVLVDSSDVELYDSFPNIDKMVGQAAVGVRLQKIATRLGLGKSLAKLSLGSAARVLPQADLDTFIAVASRPGHQEAMLAEFSQHRCYYGPQSEVPRSLGDIPLIVITAGNSVTPQERMGSLSGEQINARHQQWQKDLLRLSTRSEQLIIPAATHLSILIQPEYVAQVVESIRRMVEKVRREIKA
jgi:pimeloyl-ACP methyl ester carboxylesterase